MTAFWDMMASTGTEDGGSTHLRNVGVLIRDYLHGAVFQKAVIVIFTALRTLNFNLTVGIMSGRNGIEYIFYN
jgi:hypothetical protein